jgi:ADP-ribosylglycohydrolase
MKVGGPAGQPAVAPMTSGVRPPRHGSLMRAIPTAVFQGDADLRVAESIAISAITHDDPRCTVACAAYNQVAAALIAGASTRDAVDMGIETALEAEGNGVAAALRAGMALNLQAAATTGRSPFPGTGYVLDSLGLAIAALNDRRGLEAALIDIVRLGYDTDTNAAIAGGLLGARYGASAIPERWLERLQFADEFRQAARQSTLDC